MAEEEAGRGSGSVSGGCSKAVSYPDSTSVGSVPRASFLLDSTCPGPPVPDTADCPTVLVLVDLAWGGELIGAVGRRAGMLVLGRRRLAADSVPQYDRGRGRGRVSRLALGAGEEQ